MPCELQVPIESVGLRLDRYLASQLPSLSRTRLQELIRSGLVQVDGHLAKDSLRLKGGERISVDALEGMFEVAIALVGEAEHEL